MTQYEETRYGKIGSPNTWYELCDSPEGFRVNPVCIPAGSQSIDSLTLYTSMDSTVSRGLINIKLEGQGLMRGMFQTPVAGFSVRNDDKRLDLLQWVPPIPIDLRMPIPVYRGGNIHLYALCTDGDMGNPVFALKVGFE